MLLLFLYRCNFFAVKTFHISSNIFWFTSEYSGEFSCSLFEFCGVVQQISFLHFLLPFLILSMKQSMYRLVLSEVFCKTLSVTYPHFVSGRLECLLFMIFY